MPVLLPWAIWGCNWINSEQHRRHTPNPTAQSSYFGIEPAAVTNLTLPRLTWIRKFRPSAKPGSSMYRVELTPAEVSMQQKWLISAFLPDKPEIVQLDRSAVNILVGNDENLRAVLTPTAQSFPIPKNSTYFKAIDADGKSSCNATSFVGWQNEYVRIRRACIQWSRRLQATQYVLLPDSCHEVDLIQDTKPHQPMQRQTKRDFT